LEADASVATFKGRDASADTDACMRAEILGFSRVFGRVCDIRAFWAAKSTFWHNPTERQKKLDWLTVSTILSELLSVPIPCYRGKIHGKTPFD